MIAIRLGWRRPVAIALLDALLRMTLKPVKGIA